jgi:hypothetical protein
MGILAAVGSEGSAPPNRQFRAILFYFWRMESSTNQETHAISAERANEIASSYFSPLWAVASKIAYFFPSPLPTRRIFYGIFVNVGVRLFADRKVLMAGSSNHSRLCCFRSIVIVILTQPNAPGSSVATISSASHFTIGFHFGPCILPTCFGPICSIDDTAHICCSRLHPML